MEYSFCLDCYTEIRMKSDRENQFCRSCTCKRRCPKCGKTRLTSNHECTFQPIPAACAECSAPILCLTKSKRKVYCEKCGVNRGIIKQRSKRVALKQQFGNRCQLCGYDKCLSALCFHHKAGTKTVWWGKDKRVSFTEVAQFPERFMLICANCHAEQHATE